MVLVKGVVYKYNSFYKNVTTLEGAFYIKYIFGGTEMCYGDWLLRIAVSRTVFLFWRGFIFFGFFAKIERGKNVSCFADRFRLWWSHCGNLC